MVAVAALAAGFALGGFATSASANPVGPTTVGEFTFTADDGDVAAGAALTAYTGTDAHPVIPSAVTLAGTTYSVTSLTSATVGNSVGGLPNSTFQNDPALQELVLGNSMGGIGDFAIAFDSSLTSITWRSSLIGIGNFAFFGDSALTSVILPPSLLGLGTDAFNGAPNLDHVEFLGAPPGLVTDAGPDASLGTAPGLIVYYPWAFAQPQFAGGYTSGWHGYTTVELATITFDGKGHGGAVAAQKVAVGATAVAPTPSAGGLVFNGWYTDSALTAKANFSDPVTADETLFASWSVLAVTGQPVNAWLLPTATGLTVMGMAALLVARRRLTLGEPGTNKQG